MNRLLLMIVLLGLLTAACSTASNSAAQNSNAPASAAAENKATQAKTSTTAPAQKTSESSVQGAERIKLARGESDTDLTVNLGAGETKKFVAYVTKGFMVCIMRNADSGSRVTIKVNGKIRNPDDGPCGEHAKAAGDQVIEFTNNGDSAIPFGVSVGFHEHG
jgi:hypothetical protein